MIFTPRRVYASRPIDTARAVYVPTERRKAGLEKELDL